MFFSLFQFYNVFFEYLFSILERGLDGLSGSSRIFFKNGHEIRLKFAPSALSAFQLLAHLRPTYIIAFSTFKLKPLTVSSNTPLS